MTSHLFSIILGSITSSYMDGQQHEVVATGPDDPQQAFHTILGLECWQDIYLMGCQVQ